jgi:DtxR family Mn-dependent transcriptional regulator
MKYPIPIRRAGGCGGIPRASSGASARLGLTDVRHVASPLLTDPRAARKGLTDWCDTGLSERRGARSWLTSVGRGELARDVTRRLRLAERLLTDVLSLDRHAVDPNACVLGTHHLPGSHRIHMHSSGAPRANVPTGTRFLPGRVLRAQRRASLAHRGAVCPAWRWANPGRVAYLQLKDHPELHRLLALGVIPGAPVHLHQVFPGLCCGSGGNPVGVGIVYCRPNFCAPSGRASNFVESSPRSYATGHAHSSPSRF